MVWILITWFVGAVLAALGLGRVLAPQRSRACRR